MKVSGYGKNGRPVGSLIIGRRFTEAERELIAMGADIDEVVNAAPKLKTREEMYNAIFSKED